MVIIASRVLKSEEEASLSQCAAASSLMSSSPRSPEFLRDAAVVANGSFAYHQMDHVVVDTEGSDVSRLSLRSSLDDKDKRFACQFDPSSLKHGRSLVGCDA